MLEGACFFTQDDHAKSLMCVVFQCNNSHISPFRTLIAMSNLRHSHLVLSSSLSHSGDWLSVVPSSTLGLHLQDREFRPYLQYWLTLLIYAEDGNCPICLHLADRMGDHQVGCGGTNDRIARDHYNCNSLFFAAQSADLAPRRDMPSLIPGLEAARLTLISPTGFVINMSHWMLPLSPPCSHLLWMELHPPLNMLWGWLRSGRWWWMLRTVKQWKCISFR